jgi:hypothetical protein
LPPCIQPLTVSFPIVISDPIITLPPAPQTRHAYQRLFPSASHNQKYLGNSPLDQNLLIVHVKPLEDQHVSTASKLPSSEAPAAILLVGKDCQSIDLGHLWKI